MSDFKIVSLLNPSVVVLSGATGPAIAAGGATQTSGTVVFANTGNVTFGYSNGSITASAPSGGGGTNYVFSNSNGVSFGTSGSTVTATVATNYMASNQSSNFVNTSQSSLFQQISNTSNITSNAVNTSVSGNFAGTGFTSTTTAGTNVVATQGTNGLSVGVPAFITTYAAQTTQTQPAGNIAGVGTTFAGTNISGSMTVDTAGVNLALSVAAGGGAGDGGNVIAAGGSTAASTGTVVFGNANNVSFGLNAGTVTATATFAQSVDTNKAGTGYTSTTQAGSTVGVTNNTSGLSMAWPPFITTYAAQSVQTQASGNIVGSGFTSTSTAGVVPTATLNSNGLSFGAPAWITTYVNDLTSGRAGTGYTSTTTAGTLAGVTQNTAGLSMAWPPYITTYAAQTNQTQASGNIAGVGTTFAGTNVTATMGLNSNGLALSLSAGAGGGGTTNQTGPNIAVAGSTITSGDVLFSNSPTVTFGMAGSTITASAAGGGGAGVTIKDWFPMQMAASSTSSFAQNTIHFAHLLPQENVSFTCVEMLWSYSHSSSAIATWGKSTTLEYGIYSEGVAGTNMALMSSSTMVMQMTASSNVSFGLTISQGATSYTATTAASSLSAFNQAGWKAVSLPFAGSIPPSSAGPYYFAYRASTNSGGANVAQTHQIMMNNEVSNASIGGWSPTTVLATNKSLVQEPYGFILSVTSNALPALPAYSDMSINSNTQPYLYFEA